MDRNTANQSDIVSLSRKDFPGFQVLIGHLILCRVTNNAPTIANTEPVRTQARPPVLNSRKYKHNSHFYLHMLSEPRTLCAAELVTSGNAGRSNGPLALFDTPFEAAR